MSIKDYDVWVIRFGTVFLVAMPYADTKVCRLSQNVSDALQIADAEKARMVAGMSGGIAVKFNPITGVVGA